jgi:demethoxyubiquinone hydroxylase (CLK1/Coq7/Cat5 family)
MKEQYSQLATLVYVSAMKKQIEEEVEAKYSKRIDHLVNANNELMNELEQCESELITVEKECYGRGYSESTTAR